jgi:hypothetical protein
MSTTKLIIGAGTVFLFSVMLAGSFPAHKTYAAGGGSGGVVLAGYGFPSIGGKTCGGEDVGPITDRYIFGLKTPHGSCGTSFFLANSRREAYECAQASCTACVVEDITDRYIFSSSVPGLVDSGNYCPAVAPR